MNITVRMETATSTTGVLSIGEHEFPCTLGRTGVIAAAEKREGDGKSPLGTYPLRYVLYRADKVAKPVTALSVEAVTPEAGWCDDSTYADYNRRITLPHAAGHERLTRDDDVYDIIVILGHNDAPVVQGWGSAVFMHLARPDFSPTAGCVGLKREDLLTVLRLCTPTSTITLLPPAF